MNIWHLGPQPSIENVIRLSSSYSNIEIASKIERITCILNLWTTYIPILREAMQTTGHIVNFQWQSFRGANQALNRCATSGVPRNNKGTQSRGDSRKCVWKLHFAWTELTLEYYCLENRSTRHQEKFSTVGNCFLDNKLRLAFATGTFDVILSSLFGRCCQLFPPLLLRHHDRKPNEEIFTDLSDN